MAAMTLDVDVTQLTLPISERPDGCVLDANRGDAIGLPLASNPWYGSDRRSMAAIRERLAPPLTPIPDGPPLNARDAAAFRLHFADDVDLAYGAMYGSSQEIVAVMAVRFLDEARAKDAARRKGLLRVGRLVVGVSDGTSDCHAAVVAHVRKLMTNAAPQPR
jgi:hypothetical protein